MDLTSLVCEKHVMHDKSGFFDETKRPKDKFWDYLETQFRNKSLMGCSAAGPTGKLVVLDEGPCGIMQGHAYGINALFEIEKKQENVVEGKQNQHRLLRVRNPWGRTEWTGKWSDKSEELEDPYNKQKIEEFRDSLPFDEQFDLDADDG